MLGWEPDRFITADPMRAIRNHEVLRSARELHYKDLDYLATKTAASLAELLGPPLISLAKGINRLGRL